jgi:hypothetical protein
MHFGQLFLRNICLALAKVVNMLNNNFIHMRARGVNSLFEHTQTDTYLSTFSNRTEFEPKDKTLQKAIRYLSLHSDSTMWI